MPPLPTLRVIRSPIHGYGVVAARAIPRGAVLADVDGHLWHEREAIDDRYSLWLGDGWFFDMLDQTRWINHSCAPNAEVEGGVRDGAGWARLVALRDIAAGEEIAYDYGFTAELAEPCACASRECRGWIVDAEELPRLRRKRRRKAG